MQLADDGRNGIAAQRHAEVGIEAVDRLGQPEEGDLAQVVVVRRTAVAAGQTVDQRREPAHELLAGVRVSSQMAADEQLVGAIAAVERKGGGGGDGGFGEQGHGLLSAEGVPRCKAHAKRNMFRIICAKMRRWCPELSGYRRVNGPEREPRGTPAPAAQRRGAQPAPSSSRLRATLLAEDPDA